MAKRKAAKKSRSSRATPRGGATRRPLKRKSQKAKKTGRSTAKKRHASRKPLSRAKAATPAKAAKATKSRLAKLRAAKARLTKARAAKARVAKPRPAGSAAPRPARSASASRRKTPRLERERRVLSEPNLPSSLDMDRHGSAARTGRHELQHSLEEHTGMTSTITGGDVDANWENAYFSGDEAPGGDNPTPDQDRVDDIGRSIGLQYEDNEELTGDEKVEKRDRHRWELDPASSEDFRDRK